MMKSIVTLLIIYASLFIVIEILWSLGSQRPNEENNFLFSYLLPCVITLGLMVFSSIGLFKKRGTKKTNMKLFVTTMFIIFTVTLKGQTTFSDKNKWEQKILNDVSLGEVKASLDQKLTAYYTEKQIPRELISILEK